MKNKDCLESKIVKKVNAKDNTRKGIGSRKYNCQTYFGIKLV